MGVLRSWDHKKREALGQLLPGFRGLHELGLAARRLQIVRRCSPTSRIHLLAIAHNLLPVAAWPRQRPEAAR